MIKVRQDHESMYIVNRHNWQNTRCLWIHRWAAAGGSASIAGQRTRSYWQTQAKMNSLHQRRWRIPSDRRFHTDSSACWLTSECWSVFATNTHQSLLMINRKAHWQVSLSFHRTAGCCFWCSVCFKACVSMGYLGKLDIRQSLNKTLVCETGNPFLF